MFCSSLRKRPTWAHIVPVLLNDKTAAWKEMNLESHDIAFPVFRPGTPMSTFRITLLTARDVEASGGRQRVARLAHVSGAKGAAVLFLLGNGDVGGTGSDAMDVFMKLQVVVAMSSPMPLIPLASMSDLYPTLTSLRKKLNQGLGVMVADAGHEVGSRIVMIFSSCLGRQLTPTERAALRRIPITNVQELAQKVMDPAGQSLLREHFDEGIVKKMVGFFAGG